MGAPMLRMGSDHAAVGAQRLAVDPRAIGAGEERDGVRDVFGWPSRSSGGDLRQAVDELRRFAVEEQVRRGRPWSDRS